VTTNPARVLLHPVRLRIVLAMRSEALTTSEIAARLPDVAHATLYRQVAVLADAGVIEVVDERRVRGGVERRYALVTEAARIGPDQATAADPDALLEGFTVFAGTLIEAMSRYLDDPGAAPGDDPLSFRQAAIWLTDDDAEALLEALREVLQPYVAQGPAPGRRRVLLNTVLIPDTTAPVDVGPENAAGDR
jgi:DNA-binding transcriptional ArsR family regulator